MQGSRDFQLQLHMASQHRLGNSMLKAYKTLCVLAVICCATASVSARAASSHHVHHHGAILMSRFRPRQMDSSSISPQAHHHKRRILTDAIADNEFVTASGTAFQVTLPRISCLAFVAYCHLVRSKFKSMETESTNQHGFCLQVNGKKTFFAGTNIFYLLLQQTPTNQLGFSDDGVTEYLSQQVTEHGTY